MPSLNLGVFGVSFQFDLVVVLVRAIEAEPFERGIDRIEQPRGLQIVDPGQVAPALQPEMGEEVLRRRVR